MFFSLRYTRYGATIAPDGVMKLVMMIVLMIKLEGLVT